MHVKPELPAATRVSLAVNQSFCTLISRQSQLLPKVLLCGVLALGGCASVPQDEPTLRPLGEETVFIRQPGDEPQRHKPVKGISQDVLFKMLLAELSGQRGELQVSVDNYLELARTLQDPRVAERATKIAVYAKEDAKALEAARIWVQRAPTNIEARQVLAAMLIRAGLIDDALVHLEYSLNASPHEAAQRMRMIANFLGREQDKLAALEVMERLVERRPTDTDALFAYALLAIRAEQTDKARAALEKVIAEGPPDNNVTVAYLTVLQKEGGSAVALSWLESQVKKYPESFDLRLIYARMLADERRYEDARNEFERLAREAPDNADVRYALGLLYLEANQPDKARESFTRLIEMEERADEASYYLGQIAEAENDLDAALDWYARVSEGPTRFEADLRTALVLARQKKIEEARRHLHNIEVSGREQQIQVVRAEGEILTQEGRYEEAMQVYDEALQDTYDADLLYTRAMLAERMGRLDIVERDLRRIIERDPRNAQALNALGYTLADRTDRYAEAYELIQRALAISPNDFYILDSMGWVLYRLGRLDEAVTYLKRARALRDDPEVAAHLAEVLWVMGEKDAAREVWETALQSAPSDEKLLETIKRLAP